MKPECYGKEYYDFESGTIKIYGEMMNGLIPAEEIELAEKCIEELKSRLRGHPPNSMRYSAVVGRISAYRMFIELQKEEMVKT